MDKMQITTAIGTKWETRTLKMDWLALEQIQRDIISCPELTNEEKVHLLAWAIGAWTGRGIPEVR